MASTLAVFLGLASLLLLVRARAGGRGVRGCLRTQLAGGTSLEKTARRLHVSTATLRRRLADEGTSHREILDAMRAETARREVLAPYFAPHELAQRLGFAHPNGFYKAFKRWTGLSPREYRPPSPPMARTTR